MYKLEHIFKESYTDAKDKTRKKHKVSEDLKMEVPGMYI